MDIKHEKTLDFWTVIAALGIESFFFHFMDGVPVFVRLGVYLFTILISVLVLKDPYKGR